jgi:hypothetical protein
MRQHSPDKLGGILGGLDLAPFSAFCNGKIVDSNCRASKIICPPCGHSPAQKSTPDSLISNMLLFEMFAQIPRSQKTWAIFIVVGWVTVVGLEQAPVWISNIKLTKSNCLLAWIMLKSNQI